jgi:hypothetical protein
MSFAMSGDGMNGLSKIMIVVVAVITAGSAAAILLTPPSPQERVSRRQAEAQRLVDALTQEVWNYYHDREEFPPGDGIGTASLVKALQLPSKAGGPYMTFVEDMLTPTGDLRNPIDPETRILFYRNNRTGRSPELQVHNEKNFDLWGAGSEGVFDEVNNWNSVVSTP